MTDTAEEATTIAIINILTKHIIRLLGPVYSNGGYYPAGTASFSHWLTCHPTMMIETAQLYYGDVDPLVLDSELGERPDGARDAQECLLLFWLVFLLQLPTTHWSHQVALILTLWHTRARFRERPGFGLETSVITYIIADTNHPAVKWNIGDDYRDAIADILKRGTTLVFCIEGGLSFRYSNIPRDWAREHSDLECEPARKKPRTDSVTPLS